MTDTIESQTNPQPTPHALEAVLNAAHDGEICFRVVLNTDEPFDPPKDKPTILLISDDALCLVKPAGGVQ
jgi:hypothetical protein